MCGIFRGRNFRELNALAYINKNRGGRAYSIACFSGKSMMGLVADKTAPWRTAESQIQSDKYDFYMGHVQLPTGAKRSGGIAPAMLPLTNPPSFKPGDTEDMMLFWMNGQLIESCLAKLRPVESSDEYTHHWDTHLFARRLKDRGYYSLDDIEGQFACVAMYKGETVVFRNSLASLYVNAEHSTLSSLPADGMELIKPGIYYRMEPGKLVGFGAFQDKNIYNT